MILRNSIIVEGQMMDEICDFIRMWLVYIRRSGEQRLGAVQQVLSALTLLLVVMTNTPDSAWLRNRSLCVRISGYELQHR